VAESHVPHERVARPFLYECCGRRSYGVCFSHGNFGVLCFALFEFPLLRLGVRCSRVHSSTASQSTMSTRAPALHMGASCRHSFVVRKLPVAETAKSMFH